MRKSLNPRRLGGAVASLLTLGIASTLVAQGGVDEDVPARARDLHARAIVVDTHDDTPMRMMSEPSFDIGVRNSTGSIDIPRMREGGLDALFFWACGITVIVRKNALPVGQSLTFP